MTVTGGGDRIVRHVGQHVRSAGQEKSCYPPEKDLADLQQGRPYGCHAVLEAVYVEVLYGIQDSFHVHVEDIDDIPSELEQECRRNNG